jgi:hypothetical protein
MVPAPDGGEQAGTGSGALGRSHRAADPQAALELRDGARSLALRWCGLLQSNAAFG